MFRVRGGGVKQIFFTEHHLAGSFAAIGGQNHAQRLENERVLSYTLESDV